MHFMTGGCCMIYWYRWLAIWLRWLLLSLGTREIWSTSTDYMNIEYGQKAKSMGRVTNVNRVNIEWFTTTLLRSRTEIQLKLIWFMLYHPSVHSTIGVCFWRCDEIHHSTPFMYFANTYTNIILVSNCKLHVFEFRNELCRMSRTTLKIKRFNWIEHCATSKNCTARASATDTAHRWGWRIVLQLAQHTDVYYYYLLYFIRSRWSIYFFCLLFCHS